MIKKITLIAMLLISSLVAEEISTAEPKEVGHSAYDAAASIRRQKAINWTLASVAVALAATGLVILYKNNHD